MEPRDYRYGRSSLISDAASTMLRISWSGALLFGVAGSLTSSMLLPWLLQSTQVGPDLTTTLVQVIEHRPHWAKLFGEAFLWLGILVAGLKLLAGHLESYRHQPGLRGILARLLARWDD